MARTRFAAQFLPGLLLVLSLAASDLSGARAAGQRVTAPAPPGPPSGYVGSAACKGCHTHVYDAWRATRHSYSILTAAEARRAGYPLPRARRGGEMPSIRSWDDVSYVVGGRQRIAYADRAGRVLDSGYHHRVATWDAFPAKTMADCVRCHFTGFDAGPLHPGNAIVPGRWSELNIGCEACHGPGARHMETYDRKDIVADPSPRVCGQCHTMAGKVLPRDDLHDTHALVQIWNRDAHVTGVRFNSHNAFCSRCHSPYQGYFVEAAEGARSRVFTEEKQNVTCIACHNPHELTNRRYRRQAVSLDPPLPPRLHVHTGTDRDFTTTDFREFTTTEATCVQCHRGADRIDLDHAHATCTDCHNTFHRNRSLESRAFHDPNRPRLSCRPCHRDADHLMAILFGDPDFLRPKNIHNLRTLPSEVSTKYGFTYPGLPFQRLTPLPRESGITGSVARLVVSPPSTATPAAPAATAARGAGGSKAGSRASDGARGLLAGARHRALAHDDEVRALQGALSEEPDSIARYLELAVAYVQRNEYAGARAVIELAARIDSSRILFELPLDGGSPAGAGDRDAPPRSIAEALLPPALTPGAEAIRLWLEAWLEMRVGRFAEGAGSLGAARRLDSKSAGLAFHLGLAELGKREYAAAAEALQSALKAEPGHHGARVALGVVHMKRSRFAQAEKELERAVTGDPRDPIARYLLGRGYLRQRNAAKAVEALRAAVAADPDFLDAWFALARAHQLAGLPGSAADAYREIIRRRPGQFEPHYQLGNLLKLLSDNVAFQLQGDGEKAPPSGASPRLWRQYLSGLQRRSAEYRELALAEFALALSIRPSDLDAIRQVCEIYRRSGKLSEALECFEWLAQRQPEQWIHRYRAGTILVQLERYEDARRRLHQALTLGPTQGDIYLALGLAQVRGGRLVDAIETFERGTVFEPFNPALYTNLGAAYAQRGEFGPARKALRRALELATFPLPRVHLAWTNLALLELREGARSEAMKSLRNALHAFPDYAYARTLLEAARQPIPELRLDGGRRPEFVLNDLLEIFGEVTTVAFDNE